MTDDDLRKAKLRISNPYEQTGLLREIPPDATLIDIENVYEYEKWPAEKVYCVKCGGHRHKRGFTGDIGDGHRVLLGSKCGAELFGESWTQSEHRLRDRRKRQNLLIRMDLLLPRIPEIQATLRKWISTASRLAASRRRFRNTMPSLYAALESAAQQDQGKLVAYRKVRDWAAEERASSKKKDPKAIWQWIEETLHIMSGTMYFRNIDPNREIDDAIGRIDAAKMLSRNTDNLSTKTMARIDKEIRTSIEGLEAVAEMYRHSVQFFDEENLRGVAIWATRTNHVAGSYSSDSKQIYSHDDDKVMGLPDDYPPFDESVLILLQQAIDFQSAA